MSDDESKSKMSSSRKPTLPPGAKPKGPPSRPPVRPGASNKPAGPPGKMPPGKRPPGPPGGDGASGLTRKDFASDQDVRWCPGCGDYAVLAIDAGTGYSPRKNSVHFRNRMLKSLPLLHEHVRNAFHSWSCTHDRDRAQDLAPGS